MPDSRLDQVQNISPQFNASADAALEKKLAQYQLTKEEQQERFDAQKSFTEKTQQEKRDFKNPEEYQRRCDAKLAELAQKHNVPTNAPAPTGMGKQPIPHHQLLQMAHSGVQLDHSSRLKTINADYHKSVNNVLDRAAQEGRGPQQQSPQQNHDQNRTNDRNH